MKLFIKRVIQLIQNCIFAEIIHSMRKRMKIFEHPVLNYSFSYFFHPLRFLFPFSLFYFIFFLLLLFSSPLIHHSVIEERERSNFLPFGKRKCFLHNGRKAIVVPFNKNSRLEKDYVHSGSYNYQCKCKYEACCLRKVSWNHRQKENWKIDHSANSVTRIHFRL